MKLIAQNGGFPVLDTAALAPASGVNKDIFEAFDKVSQEGTLLPYLDYATPTFSDTAGQGLQEVLGGQRTPSRCSVTSRPTTRGSRIVSDAARKRRGSPSAVVRGGSRRTSICYRHF
ncbi:hypothetical protein [Tessaracoccus coleopterorum]|uniref:hypothetical protein n=1 Tax=Tessaracoccus coleopterorum TaxID=2714950 RepID=UPI001E35625E|nr:hypothetical protein [Tessaracoccus coleopterorum]